MGRIFFILFFICFLNFPCEAKTLPFKTRFKGEEKFKELVEKAKENHWTKLELGDRIIAVAKELVGTPYKSYTLEIDDRIEAPSVNLKGLDCWTFFEVSLGFARMLNLPEEEWTPQSLLDYIELDRYRDGVCTGSYFSRLHYLADWLFDNAAGGMVEDLSKKLGGTRFRSTCCEMTNGWRGYRYLRARPKTMLPIMKKHERRIQKLPVYHIRKSKVADIESQLQNGDIIGITTKDRGSFCSHVGLAYRDESGVLRFMHASSNYKKVVIDQRLSHYLYDFSRHAGILVARPIQ